MVKVRWSSPPTYFGDWCIQTSIAIRRVNCILRIPVQWNLYIKDTTGTTVSCPVQWNLCNKDTTGTTVSCPVQWNLCNKDTFGTTVNSPVQWNLYNKDTVCTTLSCPVQWNLYNKDTIGTTVGCAVYGGVLIWEDSNVHMWMWGMWNGTEQRCPVKGGGFISEVSFNL